MLRCGINHQADTYGVLTDHGSNLSKQAESTSQQGHVSNLCIIFIILVIVDLLTLLCCIFFKIYLVSSLTEFFLFFYLFFFFKLIFS